MDTPEVLRDQIRHEREELAGAVETLRTEIGEATDLRGKLTSKLPLVTMRLTGSPAEQLTVVVPSGKESPEPWSHETESGRPRPSTALTENVATPDVALSTVTMIGEPGNERTGVPSASVASAPTSASSTASPSRVRPRRIMCLRSSRPR